MPTPTQDYDSEVAAAEAAYTTESGAANTENTTGTTAATTALAAADDKALTTQQAIADETYLRSNSVAQTVDNRTTAVATERHDRKEADALEKKTRKETDILLQDFSGVNYKPTGATTALDGARYAAEDIDAPIANQNSLELATARTAHQLKNFQMDTTSFVGVDALSTFFPLMVVHTENCGNFDTAFGPPPVIPVPVYEPVEVTEEATVLVPFGQNIFQGRAGAVGKAIFDLREQIENTDAWDLNTKNNANAFLTIMQHDFKLHASSQFWGNGEPGAGFDSWRGNQGTGDHTPVYTINGQQFAWGTITEFQPDPVPGSYGWYCLVQLIGPLQQDVTPVTVNSTLLADDTREHAIGAAILALISGINGSSLPSASKAKALKVADLLRNDTSDALWALPTASTTSSERVGHLTADGETYSYTTTVNQTPAAQVVIVGPLNAEMIAALPHQTSNIEWYDTVLDGVKPVDSRIYAPPNLYFGGIDAPGLDFSKRLIHEGVNYFLVTFSAVFDIEATVWYRVLDVPPPLPSSAVHPWKVGTALGGAINTAAVAGAWPSPFPYRPNSTTAIFPVTLGPTQYVQFGVNCLGGNRADRPASIVVTLAGNQGVVEVSAGAYRHSGPNQSTALLVAQDAINGHIVIGAQYVGLKEKIRNEPLWDTATKDNALIVANTLLDTSIYWGPPLGPDRVDDEAAAKYGHITVGGQTFNWRTARWWDSDDVHEQYHAEVSISLPYTIHKTVDSSGKFYGGQLTLLGFNAPVTTGARSYPA